MKKTVISLGGSLVVPQTIDTQYLTQFSALIRKYSGKQQFYIIVGGGKTAREYINATELITQNLTDEDRDWLGIHTTRLNAQLVKTMFKDIAQPEIVTDPSVKIKSDYPVIIGAGYRPGNSTDFIAAKMALTNGSKVVINLSNIDHAYDKDPRVHGDAKKLTEVSWEEFKEIVGDKWVPGSSAPFDPIASRIASKHGMKVIIANGKNLPNLERILNDQTYIGTTIN